MTFLPIVERELRVAARQRSTAWFRVAAALVALVIGAGFLLMSIAMGNGPVRLGSGLFSTLTWMALAATLSAGLFFTADSLSEEKREGTLGFLFLTDLRGYDVIGGKLLATSLRGFYGLLALLPILALTLIMGGVTGAQFWKCSLALLNALFCSLAGGLLVSSLCRESQRALASTVFLLLILCAGGPLADGIWAAAHRSSFHPWFSLSSPVFVFLKASAWGRSEYWLGLLISHGLAWVALALACWFVPRTWQDKPGKFSGRGSGWRYSWKYGGARFRATHRRKLLERHPMIWLALRERWQSLGVWVLVGVVLCVFVGCLWGLPASMWVLWAQLGWLVLLVVYLWTTTFACRFFVEAKRSGLLELILVTPLSGKQIVLGQWYGLLRLFAGPAGLLILVQSIGSGLSQNATMGRIAASGGGAFPILAYQLLSGAVAVLATLGNLAALTWFGMWAGLTSRSANLAALRAILFVQILPWFVISFASSMAAGLLMFRGLLKSGPPPNSLVLVLPLVMVGLSSLLTLAKDAAFIVWARHQLSSRFRTEAAKTLGARKSVTMPRALEGLPGP